MGIPAFLTTSFTLFGNTATLGGTTVNNGPATTGGASLDLPFLCLSSPAGVCGGVVENALTTPVGNDAVDGEFGRGDSHILDTIFNNVSCPIKSGEFGGLAEARSTGNFVSLGGDDPNNILNWSFIVPADGNAADTVASFSYLGELIYKLTRDNGGDLASASSVFRIVINKISGGFLEIGQIEDAVLNLDLSLPAGIPQIFDIDESIGGPLLFTPTITIPDTLEGNLFSIDIIFGNNAQADSVVVAEPVVLGALGLGLLGIGFAARRRKVV